MGDGDKKSILIMTKKNKLKKIRRLFQQPDRKAGTRDTLMWLFDTGKDLK